MEKKVFDLLINGERANYEKWRDAVLATGSLTFETAYRRKDGSSTPVEIQSQTVVVKGKTLFLSVIRNITDRKQAEEDMRSIPLRLLEMQEKMREHAMYPKCFDTKTAQLMLFGMLLMDMSDAAQLHAIAARRAGASWEEMQAVISLCFLFRGLPAANRGAEILANLAKREADAPAAKA